MANSSIFAAFERMWQHIVTALDNKINKANPTGTGSLSLNRKANTTVGTNSVAVGYEATASGTYSLAEGNSTTASGNYSHTEGISTTASSTGAHAEGSMTTASGMYSHAEGANTVASGTQAHAEGIGTIASGSDQHVQGRYNVNGYGRYAHIVGNGTTTARSNAHTLDWSGNAWFAGNIYVGGTSQDNATAVAGVSTLTTAEYNALETAGTTNANTLYMLTDAEDEEVIPQIQIITWESDD